MQLWIDNTGLQSAGLCLDGQASQAHEYDVRGLLHLATLLIYANKVTLNGFEDNLIAKRSQEIIEQLRTIGITAETPKQPSFNLRLRAPYFYPDR